MTRSLALGLMLLSAVTAHTHAQAPADQVIGRANELFALAKKQQAEGELAAACASFAESYRLAPRGGTLINLAVCHRQLGDLVLAHQELLAAREAAHSTGRTDREAIVDVHLHALEDELAWLDVAPASDHPGTPARIQVDDAALSNEATREPVALMPGTHHIYIEADGFEPVELHITLIPGSHTRVPPQPLRPRVLQPPPAAATAPALAAEVIAAPPRVTAQNQALPARDALAVVKVSALVVGIVGIAVGLGAGAWALEKKGEVRASCDPNTLMCRNRKGLDANSAGAALALTSTIACSVGVAGFGAWLLLPGGSLNERVSAGLSFRSAF